MQVQIDLAQIFYRAPHYQHPGAHVDLSGQKRGAVWSRDLTGLLIADDADMAWYEYA